MSSPLETQPDSFAQRLFLRTLRHARPERFARRALLKAQQLLSLALADRLMALRADDDPLLVAASQIEQHTLLVALLREALDLLGARFDKLPERRRPHYTPTQRFRILRVRELAGLSIDETARLFRVSASTISHWLAHGDPVRETVGSTLTPTPPLRRYNDTVHHVVQTLALLGFGGYKRLAQHLARVGWKIAKTTVARYLREPRQPRPTLDPPQTPKRAVKARFPHHVWHLDLTEIRAFLRSGAFSLAVILDSASRMPLSWKLFERRHSSADMIALVETALVQHGKPRYLIVDQDGAFTAHAFRERIAAWPLNLRFCSAGNHRANARLERFWRALKHGLLRLGPLAETLSARDLERDIRRALVYYARHRPHQGLGGATPAEVFHALEPAHLRAVQPPRGKRGEPPVPPPATVEYLDGDLRFPFLRRVA